MILKWSCSLLLGVGIAALVACKRTGEGAAISTEQVKELARVFDRTLTLGEVVAIMPDGLNDADSVQFINAYKEQWARDMVLLHEAESNPPKDIDIEGLVQKYRESLLMHYYGQLLVELQLDSTVQQNDVLQFIKGNQDQFQLESPILRCRLAIFPASVASKSDIRRWWSEPGLSNDGQLAEEIEKEASYFLMDDQKWYNASEIGAILPTNLFNSSLPSSKKVVVSEQDGQLYLLRVLETKGTNDSPPEGYFNEKARQMILQERQRALLQQKKDEFYERELRRNNVQFLN